MVSLSKFKYPVIDPDPTPGKVISNYHSMEYGIIGASSVFGYWYGWLRGGCAAYILTLRRLRGELPNAREFAKYGALSEEEFQDRLKRMQDPVIDLISAPKKN